MNPFKYAHLFNPVYTLTHEGDSALGVPTMRLADNNKLNLALWNAIYVGGAALPLAYLINTLANQKAENEVESQLNKSLVQKLNALRPRLVSDPSLADTSAYTDLPERELKELQRVQGELEKHADGGIMDWVSDTAADFFRDSFANTLPLFMLPGAALLGTALSNNKNKERIKAELKDRRLQYRNIQGYIDRKRLAEAGLVAASAAEKPLTESVAKRKSESSDNSKADDKLTKKAGGPDDQSGEARRDSSYGLKTWFLSMPFAALALLSATLGVGTYNLLNKGDKNKAKLKYLKERQLGSNIAQDTPQLSVLDLPVSYKDILVTPQTDKSRQTRAYTGDTEDRKDGKAPKAEERSVTSKKDALF